MITQVFAYFDLKSAHYAQHDVSIWNSSHSLQSDKISDPPSSCSVFPVLIGDPYGPRPRKGLPLGQMTSANPRTSKEVAFISRNSLQES